ncbi:PepSY domain-containing protein [Rheinheimera riviphila]|uniref:PepSY domain-containing protein n=1 Tax=Rheinheimera riviphila TaxID=1834037 RepID=A0A437R0K0_9GAMM|nr:PepSY domain-containing protein [Rheinheimera riviphila]RVU40260.1 PepSY domain-containing protein [Rheinheimera riviphila]
MRIFGSIRFWRTFHLWLSLLLSLQLLAWFGSGLVMSILPIDEVRGDHLRAPVPPINWQLAKMCPAQLPAHTGGLSLRQRGEMPVYQLDHDGKLQFFNALDGSALPPLTEPELRVMAQQSYNGTGTIHSAQLIDELPLEARGLPTPVWQVQFNDTDNTVFYLEPTLGQVLRVRTDNWRLFDFVWMLHIMDYDERDDFNHGLLIASSALALLFTISGLVLLVLTLRRKAARPH